MMFAKADRPFQQDFRQRRKFAKRPLCGLLSVGKGVSVMRWLVVAPICPACLRGFAGPLVMMPFARFRSLPKAYPSGEAFNYPQVVAREIPVSALRLKPLTRL